MFVPKRQVILSLSTAIIQWWGRNRRDTIDFSVQKKKTSETHNCYWPKIILKASGTHVVRLLIRAQSRCLGINHLAVESALWYLVFWLWLLWSSFLLLTPWFYLRDHNSAFWTLGFTLWDPGFLLWIVLDL